MRLAQPVFRRMLRMWFAAVCSLINSAAPISRLLRPPATSSRICTSRADRPSGQRRRPDRRPESRAPRAQQRRHPDPLGERRRLVRAGRLRARGSAGPRASSMRPYS